MDDKIMFEKDSKGIKKHREMFPTLLTKTT